MAQASCTNAAAGFIQDKRRWVTRGCTPHPLLGLTRHLEWWATSYRGREVLQGPSDPKLLLLGCSGKAAACGSDLGQRLPWR